MVEEIRGAWVVTKGTGGGSSVGSVSASVVRYTSEEDFSVLREKRKTNVARRSAFHHAAHCRVSFAARRVHRESRRIASRDFSRKPFAAARRAARGPRATERRGTSEGAGATSASSRLVVPRERGRDASRAGGVDAGTRAGAIARPRVVRFDHRHRREMGRREGRHYDVRVGFRAGGASRNTRTELGTSPLAAVARLKHSPMTPRASRVTCRPREVVT